MTYEQMIVARRENGTVEAAGWDCVETRLDAKEWLERGLVLEFVTAAQVEAMNEEADVFSTIAPIGTVLSHEQALHVVADDNVLYAANGNTYN